MLPAIALIGNKISPDPILQYNLIEVVPIAFGGRLVALKVAPDSLWHRLYAECLPDSAAVYAGDRSKRLCRLDAQYVE